MTFYINNGLSVELIDLIENALGVDVKKVKQQDIPAFDSKGVKRIISPWALHLGERAPCARLYIQFLEFSVQLVQVKA